MQWSKSVVNLLILRIGQRIVERRISFGHRWFISEREREKMSDEKVRPEKQRYLPGTE